MGLGTYAEVRNFRVRDQSEPIRIGLKLVDHIHHSPDFDPINEPIYTHAEPDQRVAPSAAPSLAAFGPEDPTTFPPIVTARDALEGPDPSFFEVLWSLEFGKSSDPQSGFAKIQQVNYAATVSYHEEEEWGECSSFFSIDCRLLAELKEAELRNSDLLRHGLSRSDTPVGIQADGTGHITNTRTMSGSVEKSVLEFDALELEGGIPKNLLVWRSRTDQAGTDREELIGGRYGWDYELLDTMELTIRDLFGSAGFSDFKYLGPLREPPRTRHDRGSTGTHLGNNGEYAAVVLHEFINHGVNVPLPDGHVRRVRLGAALDEWIQWIELADGVSVADQGRDGLAFKVRREGTATEVDLTAVGVGVSQALPVILMCLLSASGDLLIFEQPELHLHPATQQRMADFLLAFASTGRQILLETHSEHLVNRLRYQVASDDTDRAANLIKLLFAEQTEGITNYRESTINLYGGVSEDWPAGFFDISAKSAQDLVRAHLNKRQRTADSVDGVRQPETS